MQTIAVFNTRGGSGKSAVTVFLADFLSAAFKKRVLVIDLDPQQSSSVALLGEDRLYEAFTRRKSWPTLIRRVSHGAIASKDVLQSTIDRPPTPGRKGVVYLAPITVMACEREAWQLLDEELTRLPTVKRKPSYQLLSKLLQPIQNEFDICLIDFPGHETGPITMNGLRAAQWWLFPCVPDRAGIRDIEGPVAAINQAYKGAPKRMRGLGTLLSISQSASSSEYRQSLQTLKNAAEKKIIPKLLPDKAKMLIWTGARNALDDTLWNGSTTLKKKYKDKPLSDAMRVLCRELTKRMKIPADEVQLDFSLLNGLNSMLRKVFVGSKN